STIIPDLFRIFVVEMLMHRIVELRRVGTRPDMVHGVDIGFVRCQPVEENLPLDLLPVPLAFEIGRLVRPPEFIHQDQVRISLAVQETHQVTADKAGRAGHNDISVHDLESRIWSMTGEFAGAPASLPPPGRPSPCRWLRRNFPSIPPPSPSRLHPP